jgi:Arm DNA-binding domain
MKAKITRELLRDLKPAAATLDVIDTELRGFVARMSPSGTITYGIRYTNRDRRQCRHSLGRTFPATTVSAAREEARSLLASTPPRKSAPSAARFLHWARSLMSSTGSGSP